MDNRPIGVFDSGLGGLTAVRTLMQVLPNEDLIYLGDTGRVPYGGRSRETIIKYARQDIAFLQGFDIKTVVVACGTVSTNALEAISGDYTVPVFGVVEEAARRASEITRNRKIGIIGTQASINSGAYDRLVLKYLPEAEVFGKACPLFVPLVENGRIHRGDVVIETVAREYLLPLRDEGIDTLIMGCTHYPLLGEVIAEIMGPAVNLVSPGEETAKYVAGLLSDSGLLTDRQEAGRHKYYVTDSTDNFTSVASMFLQTDILGEVSQVSLENFDKMKKIV